MDVVIGEMRKMRDEEAHHPGKLAFALICSKFLC